MTPNLYLFKPSRSSHPKGIYHLEAAHYTGLPGIRCPNCDTWATTGVYYPSIQDPALLDIVSQLDGTPLPLDSWEALVNRVRPYFGNQRAIEPGTDFGPLTGTVHGKPMPLMWVDPWTPVLSDKFLSKLKQAGVNVSAVQAKLDGEHVTEPLWDLEIWPTAKLAAHDFEVCDVCGRMSSHAPDKIILDGNNLDHNAPLQRIIELPTFIVASQEFVDVLKSFEKGDSTVIPIETRFGK